MHTETALTAIFNGESGLAGCPLDSHSTVYFYSERPPGTGQNFVLFSTQFHQVFSDDGWFPRSTYIAS